MKIMLHQELIDSLYKLYNTSFFPFFYFPLAGAPGSASYSASKHALQVYDVYHTIPIMWSMYACGMNRFKISYTRKHHKNLKFQYYPCT